MKKLAATILLTLCLNAHALDEVTCLAQNIYREARGESKLGKLAVAQVTINRTKIDTYPDTICQVVYQPNQFSWTKKYKKTVPDKNSIDIAKLALSGKHSLANFKATHFNTKGVPFKFKAKKLITIGNHEFYKL